MSNKRSVIDIISIIGSIAVVGIVGFALVYLLVLQPFYKSESYEKLLWADFTDMQQEEKTEEVSGNFSSLTVQNISGPIRIEAWNNDSIQVHYIKEARTEKALAEFQIEIQRRGSSLSVRPIYKRKWKAQFGSVSFDIKVPVSIKEITAHNISGSITIDTIDELLSGSDQELSTISGSIRTGGSRDLKAKSTSGSIRFSSMGKHLSLETVSGSIKGNILNLDEKGSAELKSVSGSIEIEAFEALDASVDLSSVSGSLSCDFPIEVAQMKRNKIEGKIGKGSAEFTARTVSGKIELTKLD